MRQIRQLRPDEWQTYRDVRLTALQDSPDAFCASYADSAQITEDAWRDRCTQPHWFAFDGERAVGMVRVTRHDNKQLPELISMWVAPEARGSGVAADLVHAVLDWARQQHDAGVYLNVITDNDRAASLYRRLGFTPTGATADLPDGRHETELEIRF